MKMTMLMKTLRVAGLFSIMGAAALAQKASVAAGVAFDYGRANLVQGCNCFNLYGGAAEVQFGLTPRLFLLADYTRAQQSGLTPDGYRLTQSTYLGGMRYVAWAGKRKPSLFADAVAGLADAGGSLSPARTGYGSAHAFAFQTGGGLQVPVGRHWLFVPAQAEYLLTTFSNGGSNRQNQLRLQAGVLFRLRK